MVSNLSIRFYLNKNKVVGDKQKIYCRITVNRLKSEFYTGFAVSPEFWNEERRTTNNIEINTELVEIENRIYSIRRNLIDHGIEVTASNIVDLFKGKKSARTYILKYFEQHIKYIYEKGEHSKVTLSQYRATHKILKQFITENLKKQDLLLDEINFRFVEELDNFMLTKYKDPHNRNIERNTINKHHSRLRTVLNKAINEDLVAKSPYVKFKLKDKKTSRQFLTSNELTKIRELDLSEKTSLDKVRDIFLFSCYTGLRFNDAMSLKMSDIAISEDKVKFISLKMHKTQDFVMVPLIQEAQGIINKYNQHPDREVLGLILPRLSNQKTNAYLKVIADLTGIKKPITHHIARHTFATQALNRSIPVEVVQKFMGHTDIQTTQIYAKLLTSTIVREMEKMGKVR